MPIYCVCCELTDAMSHLRVVLPAIATVIAGLGPSLHVAPLTWLVKTESPVGVVLDRLWPQVLAAPERILVFAVHCGSEWRLHSGSSQDEVEGWLKRHLSE